MDRQNDIPVVSPSSVLFPVDKTEFGCGVTLSHIAIYTDRLMDRQNDIPVVSPSSVLIHVDMTESGCGVTLSHIAIVYIQTDWWTDRQTLHTCSFSFICSDSCWYDRIWLRSNAIAYRYRIYTDRQMDRQTDGQTDWHTCSFSFICSVSCW